MRERYTLRIHKKGVYEKSGRALSSDYNKFDFIITSSKGHERFYEEHSPYYNEAKQKIYDDIKNNWKKIKVVQDRELYFANPTITIYENPN